MPACIETGQLTSERNDFWDMQPTLIKSMSRKYKWQLMVTYFLFALEMLGTLLRPLLLGAAINDLLKGSYHGLVVMSFVHAAWMVIGVIRNRYDTRTYTAIYNLIGSIILLCFYDWHVALICVLVFIPVAWLSHLYRRKVEGLYQQKNDELEKQVAVLATNDRVSIKRHYYDLRR
jgi:ABC-type multidrug transport system fused ATPase/permease subunit